MTKRLKDKRRNNDVKHITQKAKEPIRKTGVNSDAPEG
jgi:hypothetical protein